MFSYTTPTIPLYRRAPRATSWLLVASVLLTAVALLSPVQIPVALYKLSLISLAAAVGYWVDRSIFPYSRPDGYLQEDWRYGTDEPAYQVDFAVVDGYRYVFAAAMLRRAIVVAAVVIGVALGL
ncbi:putative holin [Sapientia aquatica]|uniref:Holin n=1 Tax=Sapientia aquatica TaxID=1549640 RepID=A0A4R5W1J1_9BURK|nr:putative holin [Sapientia aquatica]TDK65995.1 hypothetical protein E2I14_10405 [Sapientia aquatica]